MVLLLLLGTGCGRPPEARLAEDGTPTRGGTLIVVGASDVDHLATTSAYLTGALWLMRAFTRQLVTYPPASDYATATALVADAARELPARENGGVSADGRTYTFHLRPGIRWNTTPARAVVAGDFVRAFKLFCNPVSPVGAPTYYTTTIAGMAEYCSSFLRAPATVDEIRRFVDTHELAGVRAPDDATLVFELVAPATDFLSLLALPFASAVPVEYLDYLPDGPELRQHTLSDGPYAIVRYQQNRSIELERNPAWDPAADPVHPAYVDRIHIKIGVDAELGQLQIEAGTADLPFDESMLTANQASLRAIGDPRVTLFPPGDHYGSFHYLVINTAHGATAKLAVRRALALAIDKGTLAQLTGGPGVSRPLYQAVPSTVSGYRAGADRDVTPDAQGAPGAAHDLLAAAGFPDGVPLRLAFAQNSTYGLEAQALQASLRRAGFDARVFPFPMSDFFGRLMPNAENAQRGEWDVALGAWVPDWFGANNGRSVIGPLFDGRQLGRISQNYGLYAESRTDAAIDRALAASTTAGAEAGWADACDQVMDDVAIVPLIERKNAYMRSSRVRGCVWTVMGFNCDPTALWLAAGAP